MESAVRGASFFDHGNGFLAWSTNEPGKRPAFPSCVIGSQRLHESKHAGILQVPKLCAGKFSVAGRSHRPHLSSAASRHSYLGERMNDEAELLPGTLDLLILKAVSLGALHGYAVLSRIEQISGRTLFVEQGALYPALFRLVRQGLLETEWGKSENNRRAKFYELTAKGRRRLREETDGWNRTVAAVSAALSARPQEI